MMRAELVNRKGALTYIGWDNWYDRPSERLPYYFPYYLYQFKKRRITLPIVNEEFVDWQEYEPAPDDYGADIIKEITTDLTVVDLYCTSISMDEADVSEILGGDGTKERPWKNIYTMLSFLRCLSHDNVYDRQMLCNVGGEIYLQINISGIIDYDYDQFLKKCNINMPIINDVNKVVQVILNFENCTITSECAPCTFKSFTGMHKHIIENLTLDITASGESQTFNISADIVLNSNISSNENLREVNGTISDCHIIINKSANYDDANDNEPGVCGGTIILRSSFIFNGLPHFGAIGDFIKDCNIDVSGVPRYDFERNGALSGMLKAYNVNIKLPVYMPENIDVHKYCWKSVSVGSAYKCNIENAAVSGTFYNSNVTGMCNGGLQANNSNFDFYFRRHEPKYDQAFGTLNVKTLINTKIAIKTQLHNLIGGDQMSTILMYLIGYLEDDPPEEAEPYGGSPVILNSEITFTFTEHPVRGVYMYTIDVTMGSNNDVDLDGYSVTIANSKITATNKPTLDEDIPYGCARIYDIYDRYDNVPVNISNSEILTLCVSKGATRCCEDFER